MRAARADDWSEALRRLVERRCGSVREAARVSRRSYQGVDNWLRGREPRLTTLLAFLEAIGADLRDYQHELDVVRQERDSTHPL